MDKSFLILIVKFAENRGLKQEIASFLKKKKQKTFIRCAVRKRHDLAAGSGEAHRIV
jgi:hypothetical protein